MFSWPNSYSCKLLQMSGSCSRSSWKSAGSCILFKGEYFWPVVEFWNNYAIQQERKISILQSNMCRRSSQADQKPSLQSTVCLGCCCGMNGAHARHILQFIFWKDVLKANQQTCLKRKGQENVYFQCNGSYCNNSHNVMWFI